MCGLCCTHQKKKFEYKNLCYIFVAVITALEIFFWFLCRFSVFLISVSAIYDSNIQISITCPKQGHNYLRMHENYFIPLYNLCHFGPIGPEFPFGRERSWVNTCPRQGHKMELYFTRFATFFTWDALVWIGPGYYVRD